MQVQFHKTNVDVKEIKDHIMSTMPVKTAQFLQDSASTPSLSNKISGRKTKKSIFTVDGSDEIEKTFLPNPTHPYDHFIVVGFI